MGVGSEVFAIAERYVERHAALDPVAATLEGIGGHDAELTDYSPDGADERADHDRATLAALGRAPDEDDADRLAAAVMRDRLSTQLELHELGEHLRWCNVLQSPIQEIRQAFDLMPADDAAELAVVAARLARVPEALAGLTAAYRAGAAAGLVPGVRQVLACARQAEVWSGTDPAATRPYFLRFVDAYDRLGLHDAGLRAALERHAARAGEAYAALARFLRDELAPAATDRDGVGRERYAVWLRSWCGTQLDLDELYAWGWEEIRRIDAATGRVIERIRPGATLGEVVDLLDTDPARGIEGPERFVAWLQELIDRTVDELDGRHFDIPAPLRRVEACLAPAGGAAAMYYTPPSEDFSRPGRTWYPTLGRTWFPLWGEVSVCYHEAVPGHHLQLGWVRLLADRLTRYQRTLAWVAGHGEGWALYAERLMGELGFLEVPDHELGMLRSQALRAVRVVVDLGLHLDLPIPRDADFQPGERWTPERALEFAVERARFPRDFMTSEIDRYLGVPGQAISYKVGERVWLAARERARRRLGPAFDLRAWHAAALGLGSMGLDLLDRELDRLAGNPTGPVAPAAG